MTIHPQWTTKNKSKPDFLKNIQSIPECKVKYLQLTYLNPNSQKIMKFQTLFIKCFPFITELDIKITKTTDLFSQEKYNLFFIFFL